MVWGRRQNRTPTLFVHNCHTFMRINNTPSCALICSSTTELGYAAAQNFAYASRFRKPERDVQLQTVQTKQCLSYRTHHISHSIFRGTASRECCISHQSRGQLTQPSLLDDLCVSRITIVSLHHSTAGQFLLLSTPVKFARRIFDRLSSHQRFRRAQFFNFSRPRL